MKLASVDILCADIIGTLTQNKLSLGDSFTVNNFPADQLTIKHDNESLIWLLFLIDGEIMSRFVANAIKTGCAEKLLINHFIKKSPKTLLSDFSLF